MAPTPTPISTAVAAADSHFRTLVCQLCAQLFTTGAATGTGGGMCVLEGGRLYVAPSGVPKERIAPADVFVVSPADGYAVVVPPVTPGLSLSACLPLFSLAIERRGAGAVVHSHSVATVMAGLLAVRPVKEADVRGGVTEVFQVSHLEMLKGLWWGGRDAAADTRLAAAGKVGVGERHGRVGYEDTLTIPVIRNTPYESELVSGMAAAMDAYPDAPAVMVKRHGVYVWGGGWEAAKGANECLEFLFQVAARMQEAGIGLVGGDK